MPEQETRKDTSRKKIIEAASRRLRQEGFSGSGIATIMGDAGLTHGAFYAHFANRQALLAAGFAEALRENRPRWLTCPPALLWPEKLEYLADRYLTAGHRDDLGNSCALAALVSDFARSEPALCAVYEEELLKTLSAICGDVAGEGVSERQNLALMFFALCLGGISLSRAVADRQLSEQILTAAKEGIERMVAASSRCFAQEQDDKGEKKSKGVPRLADFPFRSSDKLRYADTDRQGHVNNAVFSTLLETGRVEILYGPEGVLHNPECSFVIVRQEVDYLAELTWPGQVDIGTRVLSLGASSICFEHVLFMGTTCVARAKVVVVQVNDREKKAEALSSKAREILAQYINEKDYFDEREVCSDY